MKIKVLRRPEALSQPRTMGMVTGVQIVDVDILPSCAAKRSTRYAPGYEADHADKTCKMSARYEIDGVPMCARHAGEVTLAHALENQTT